MATTSETSEERVCGYRSCGKSLAGRPAQTRYCNSKCRTLQLTTKIDERTGEERELRIGFGCAHPRERQAEITPGDQKRGHRHPGTDDRPEWSGWCVYTDCECPCNAGSEAEDA
jgi:hypothetical protein